MIRVSDINTLKNQMNVGDNVKTPEGNATIITKYPNIVRTSKGTFSWVDIYMSNSSVIED